MRSVSLGARPVLLIGSFSGPLASGRRVPLTVFWVPEKPWRSRQTRSPHSWSCQSRRQEVSRTPQPIRRQHAEGEWPRLLKRHIPGPESGVCGPGSFHCPLPRTAAGGANAPHGVDEDAEARGGGTCRRSHGLCTEVTRWFSLQLRGTGLAACHRPVPPSAGQQRPQWAPPNHQPWVS